MTMEATLDNGIKITTDGYVVKKDGTRTALKAGQCVDKDGNIKMKESKMKKKSTAPDSK